MSWLIVGTVPRNDFPLVAGPCRLTGRNLLLGQEVLEIGRGTTALLAAACAAAQTIGMALPHAILVGDTGRGDGSRRLYRHLVNHPEMLARELLVFHYLQPDVDWHNRILMGIDDLEARPLLVADAGYMYVAKMSGYAGSYDLFTPDVGELAFLADEMAPHPFYTRGFLLQEEDRVEELVARAYAYENAARYLLVKGCRDVVASVQGMIDAVTEPTVEAMEPMGGTGDTLTGLVSALLAAGYPITSAASLAARANRIIGALAKPTPAHAIADLLAHLPQALSSALDAEAAVIGHELKVIASA